MQLVLDVTRLSRDETSPRINYKTRIIFFFVQNWSEFRRLLIGIDTRSRLIPLNFTRDIFDSFDL